MKPQVHKAKSTIQKYQKNIRKTLKRSQALPLLHPDKQVIGMRKCLIRLRKKRVRKSLSVLT